MVACEYFGHKIQDNYHDYFQKTIAINESFLEIYLDKMRKTDFKETSIYHNSFPK